MNTVLEQALRYARSGLRVIPIAPKSKFPRGIEGWQDVATTDPDTITRWWTDTYPNHGIGIATGHRDDGTFFFVLDVDDRPTHNGSNTLTNLCTEHGPLPDTLTVITGSGGRHYYFTSTTAVHNDAGKRLGPGLDIRGVGGQVLAPPTIHPNGQPYTWHTTQRLAAAPQWLEHLLTYEPTLEQTDANLPGRDELLTGGNRPSDRFNATHNWRELLTAEGWTWSHQDKNVDYWTRPGKDAREGISATTNWNGLDRLIVFTTNANIPAGAYTKFGFWAQLRHRGDWKAATADYLHRNPAPTTPTTPTDTHNAFIIWPDFWNENYESDDDWLVKPVIARKRQTAIFAQAKQGKSLFVLHCVAALATGRPVLGHPAQPPVDIVYLDYEMTPDDLQGRLYAMGYDESVDLSKLHYALIPSLPPLDSPEGATAVMALIEATGSQVLVIDTMGRAVTGEENSADTYRNFARHLGMQLKARGIALIRTDHAGKNIGKGQRGSSGKNDDVDLVFSLTKADGTLTLKRTHSRLNLASDRYTYRELDSPLRYEPADPDPELPTMTALQTAIHANIIRMALDPTLSVNKAAKAYRDAGQSVTTGDFRIAWATYRDALERSAQTAQTLGTPSAQPDDRATAQTAQPTARLRHKGGTLGTTQRAQGAAQATHVVVAVPPVPEEPTLPDYF